MSSSLLRFGVCFLGFCLVLVSGAFVVFVCLFFPFFLAITGSGNRIFPIVRNRFIGQHDYPFRLDF